MEIKIINNRVSDNNTYIIKYNDNQCIIIDPSCNDGRIECEIKELSLNAILLTHGHYDHFTDVASLHDKYKDVPIYVASEDMEFVDGSKYIFSSQPSLNVRYINQEELTPITQFHYNFNGLDVDIYPMPGHSKGCITYKIGNNLFTGDVLFAKSIGRTDLPGGNNREMNSSLASFSQFDINCVVYPGHGPSTTLKQEYLTNPWLIHAARGRKSR